MLDLDGKGQTGKRRGNSTTELDDRGSLTTCTMCGMFYEMFPVVKNFEKIKLGVNEESTFGQSKTKTVINQTQITMRIWRRPANQTWIVEEIEYSKLNRNQLMWGKTIRTVETVMV